MCGAPRRAPHDKRCDERCRAGEQSEEKREEARAQDNGLRKAHTELATCERQKRLVHLHEAQQAAHLSSGMGARLVDVDVTELVIAYDAQVHEECWPDCLQHADRGTRGEILHASHGNQRHGYYAQLRS